MLLVIGLIIHYFTKCKYFLVHFVYYNMVLKMIYSLSHTVVKKKKKEKKNNKNNLSRLVTNGKQYKHQNSSQFMVKRHMS